MDEKLNKPYDPKATETRIYTTWEKSGFFNPERCIEAGVTKPDAKPFTIMMPPPNATGTLHMGHAMFLTLEDIMIRYKRMRGFRTLWLPGTDHAAIATQAKVEKDIYKKESKSRHDLGREELLKRIDAFVQENRNTMTTQMRVMGASCDWSREAFTLDEARNRAVNTLFKKMYDDGLIYRGHRIVNWDPKGQTTIADDELVYVEEKAKFYYLKYGPFSIGTARPETKFGDKYVVMHPDDTRYKQYAHGQKLTVEWINGPIEATIIKDEAADMEFGTGVMTITPWHSVVDFELAEKHKLDREQIIDQFGKLLPIAGEFAGMKIKDAREKIVEKLASKGLVEKVEDYTHNIATAERTGGIIEPQIMNQWFVAVNKEFTLPHSDIDGIASGSKTTLKEIMRKTVENNQIKIIPEYFDKTYFHWIDNLRDWCISRQIWYGHRIPVWYNKDQNIYLPEIQEIYFLRHGESAKNSEGQYVITKKGEEQAHEAIEKLKGLNITKIFCSDYQRAKRTAEIIAEGLNVPVVVEPLFREVGPEFPDGEVGALTREIFKERVPGKTLKDEFDRAEEAIEYLKKESKGEKILLVSHSFFYSCIQAKMLGIKDEDTFWMRRPNLITKNCEVRKAQFLTLPEGKNLTQDSDTLDTWFSAGSWTFSTLGWPDKTKDLEMYHPTDVLETAYEILFFWVARMILMTGYALGTIPFHTIYLHGLVRDAQGRKFSKSLGNGIDPIVIADKFGADAGRMALVIGTAPGTDSKISEDKIKGYKHFANKIWNVTRFILENAKSQDAQVKPGHFSPGLTWAKDANLTSKDAELWNDFGAIAKDITADLDEYRFHLASEKIYHYIWHELADKIIEESKPILKMENDEANSRATLLGKILIDCLKLLHPFMPFVTEEIWSMLPSKDSELLMVSKWPE